MGPNQAPQIQFFLEFKGLAAKLKSPLAPVNRALV